LSRLNGMVAVVTGASSGIGWAVADSFAAQGARVIATDIKEPIEAHRSEVRFSELDVSDERHWQRVVGEAVDEHGGIDLLVNNAADSAPESLIDTTTEEWNRVLSVTLTGSFLGMREVIPVMQRRGKGSIINISSIYGISAVPLAAAYHAAKGAIRTLSKHAAVAYAADGIRVNSLHPGFVDTPATRGQDPQFNQAVVDATPLGRAAQPSELAAACVYLASEESSFVTGSELVVDGGYLAR
jgi:NAD(P)-dependent dehydrogenase (short-subunit alcohol dehydrogenase family)